MNFSTGSRHQRPQVRVLREDVLQRGAHGIPQEEDAHTRRRPSIRVVSVDNVTSISCESSGEIHASNLLAELKTSMFYVTQIFLTLPILFQSALRQELQV